MFAIKISIFYLEYAKFVSREPTSNEDLDTGLCLEINLWSRSQILIASGLVLNLEVMWL